MKNIYITFCILFIISCQTMKSKKLSPDDIIISDKKSYAFPEAVTSKEVREDIDFLIYTLSNGYGGKNYVPGDTFSDSIKTLKKISEGSSLEVFHDKVDEALYLIPDNHLYALYKGRTSMKRESMEREGRVGKNNIKDPKKLWEVRNDKIGKKNVFYNPIFTRKFYLILHPILIG